MERRNQGYQKGKTSWILSSFDTKDSNPSANKFKRKRKVEEKSIKRIRSQPVQTSEPVIMNDGVTWVEKYAPKTKEQLAVNKKKILQVEEWVKQALSVCHSHNKAPILLLTGPSGCGKSATVKVLANELKLELKEWSNASQSHCGQWEHEHYSNITSQTALFNRFLLHENKYSSVFAKTKCQKLMLVEEYPNVYLKNVSLFHSVLQKYWKIGKCPLIFILSDNSKGQSFEQLLFPKYFIEELNLTEIGFNSASSTLMVKALQQIVQDCNLLLGESKTRKSALENIAALSSGDIRNAINCLQFMHNPKVVHCFHTDKSKKSSVVEKCGTFSVGRDTSLFLFHSLGKILYNKRENELCNVFCQDKAHLNRPQLKENPEEVFHRTSTSSTTFILFLHQNYLDFMDKMETVAECCTCFGDSDVIGSEWTEQSVLQDYSASIVNRSLMFYLYSNNSNRWRPLHKPQWYSMQKLYYANFDALREISQRWKMSSKELSTQILPYLSKISPLRLTADEKKIATYDAFISKKKGDDLGEKEAFEDYSMEDSALIGSTSCEIPSDNIENEMYLIEEFDDE